VIKIKFSRPDCSTKKLTSVLGARKATHHRTPSRAAVQRCNLTDSKLTSDYQADYAHGLELKERFLRGALTMDFTPCSIHYYIGLMQNPSQHLITATAIKFKRLSLVIRRTTNNHARTAVCKARQNQSVSYYVFRHQKWIRAIIGTRFSDSDI